MLKKLSTDKEAALVISTEKAVYHLVLPANSSVEMRSLEEMWEGISPDAALIKLNEPK